jgi:glycosyltransferase involved in cell wall biosynthesis
VFGSLERAGAQLRTLEVCDRLCVTDAMRYDFCHLDLGPNELVEDLRRRGAGTYRVSIRSPRFPLEFSGLLRRNRYDIVLTEPQFLSGFVVWLAALQHVPGRIVVIHNSIGDGRTARNPIVRVILTSAFFVWAMRHLMRRYATHVIGVSRSALDSVMPARWRSGVDHRVIYNGTDIAPFQERIDHRGVRDEFGWPSDSRIVVNVGRLSVQKNHRSILETMRLVCDEDPTVRLLLIGGGKLGHEIDASIDRLELRDVCVLTDGRADVPRLLLASDVFFFPSLWEGLPGSPLEALAAGLPVVASDIPSIREIMPFFPDSIRVAAPNDVETHAKHLREALALSKDRRQMQERFQASPFVLETCVDAYRSLFALGEGGEGWREALAAS